MSGILNKLGLGHSHDSTSAHSSTSASSSSSASHTSHSTTSTTSHSTGAMTTGTAGTTVNKTGYADSTATTSAYAHTNPGAVTSQTTTTTTTTQAGAYPAGQTAAVGTAAVGTAAADGYMTRSEERLLVGKEQVGAGVASLHKYVTSEHVHTAVPITREHVVIEREPIVAGDALSRGAEIKEAHIEVALTEERAVAAKEAVAVEKVKLRKEVEHTTQNVDAELRKEHIEFGTTNETTHAKTLGAAPGTAGYTTTNTTTGTTGSANIDPVANPRV